MSNDTITDNIYASIIDTLTNDYNLSTLDMISVLKQLDKKLPIGIVELVRDARHGDGSVTWEQIGAALGVSTQAAHYGYSKVAGIK